MKRKRQSLTALRRLAREAADAFERKADLLAANAIGPDNRASLVHHIRLNHDGTIDRQIVPEPRMTHPDTPWHVRPETHACREAAALLRRNPDSIGKNMTVRAPVSVQDTVRDARRLYGDNAAAVLCRQLETIDPDDYHAPAVRRWNAALRQMVNGDFKRQSRHTTG